jgi:hypothetical protein
MALTREGLCVGAHKDRLGLERQGSEHCTEPSIGDGREKGMNYETIIWTAFISILIAAVGGIVSEWLWHRAHKSLLPPPKATTRREVYDAWRH